MKKKIRFFTLKHVQFVRGGCYCNNDGGGGCVSEFGGRGVGDGGGGIDGDDGRGGCGERGDCAGGRVGGLPPFSSCLTTLL
jgi:hypothetical protein